MIYLELFWSFFQVGLFSVGGGYAAMPVIQEQIVHNHAWLTMNEFVDIITIAEMTPGPIAINAASFVGMKIAGGWGGIIATLGCIVPSCILVLTVAYFYVKYKNIWLMQGILSGLRPIVVALIASAGLSILWLALFDGNIASWIQIRLSMLNGVTAILFGVGFWSLRRFKTQPIYVMLGCGLLGLVLQQWL